MVVLTAGAGGPVPADYSRAGYAGGAATPVKKQDRLCLHTP